MAKRAPAGYGLIQELLAELVATFALAGRMAPLAVGSVVMPPGARRA